MPKTNIELLKAVDKIAKTGNNVTLANDDMQEFLINVVANSETLDMLHPRYAIAPEGQIDKLGVKRRTLRADLGVNSTTDGTDVVENGNVPYKLAKMSLSFWLEKDNIFYAAKQRGQDVKAAIVELVQKQISADLQDLAFNGDKADTSDDKDFLTLVDGFITRAKTNAVSKVTGSTLPTVDQLVTKLSADIEDKYLTNDYKLFMTRKTHDQYVSQLIARETPLGDATLTGGNLTYLNGYEVKVVSNMVEDVVLFTTIDNIKPVFGYEVRFVLAPEDSLSVAKNAIFCKSTVHADFVIVEDKMVGIASVTP